MIRTAVKSGNIRSIGFENGVMAIEFASGAVYHYTGPKVAEYHEGIMKAESVGKYFASVMRNCPDTVVTMVPNDGRVQQPDAEKSA